MILAGFSRRCPGEKIRRRNRYWPHFTLLLGEEERLNADDDPRRYYVEGQNARGADSLEQRRAIRRIPWKRRTIRNVTVRVRVARRRKGFGWHCEKVEVGRMAIMALLAP